MSLAQLFPYSVWECWWLAPAALIFDLWLGDPDLPWRHPVCAVGKLLEKLEAPARNFMRAGGPEAERLRGRFAGAVALAVLVGCTGLVIWGLVCLPVLQDGRPVDGPSSLLPVSFCSFRRHLHSVHGIRG